MATKRKGAAMAEDAFKTPEVRTRRYLPTSPPPGQEEPPSQGTSLKINLTKKTDVPKVKMHLMSIVYLKS